MKTFASLLFAAALASSAVAADTPLFNAVLTMGKEHRFVLVSPTGTTSSFLKLGGTFEGYKLKAYDAKTSELTLERDGKESKVGLVADAANTGVVESASKATVANATNVLNLMNFEQMLDRTMVAVRKQQAAGMDQMMGPMMRNAPPEAREAVVAFQKKVMEELMSGMSGAALKDDVAKIYSDVFTKEELQGLGSFYQSPLGKSFSEKQPELAEKMNGVVMTRMMSAMPKVQQMMKDFGEEMRAKRAAAGPAPTPVPTPAPGN